MEKTFILLKWRQCCFHTPLWPKLGVSGAEDKKWGKVPHAYLVLHKPVSAEELTAYCKERLAKYKI
nr:hypothetical protein P5640_00505 [Bacillus subtilis]